MDREPYKPAGYCPSCGHAIDPGTCPECGNTVPASRLKSSPRWKIRRRRIRRAIWLTLAIGCVLGGVYLYRHPSIWLPHAPTRLLLVFQGDEGSLTMTELARRWSEGNLTQIQADDMLAGMVTFPEGLVIPNPHPAGVELRVRLPFKSRAKLPGWTISASSSKVIVDGEPVPWVDHRLPVGLGLVGSPARGYAFWAAFPQDLLADGAIAPLSPGDHEISCRVEMSIQSDSVRLPPAMKVMPVASRTVTMWLHVENRPVDNYVRGNTDPDVTAELGRRISVAVYCGTRKYFEGACVEGSFRGDYPPIAVAADVQASPSDENKYTTCAQVLCKPGVDTRAWGGEGWSDWRCTFFRWDARSVSPRVDIRLVPNYELALHAGLTEFYGGVIEWRGANATLLNDLDTIPEPFKFEPAGYILPTHLNGATNPVPASQPCPGQPCPFSTGMLSWRGRVRVDRTYLP